MAAAIAVLQGLQTATTVVRVGVAANNVYNELNEPPPRVLTIAEQQALARERQEKQEQERRRNAGAAQELERKNRLRMYWSCWFSCVFFVFLNCVLFLFVVAVCFVVLLNCLLV